MNKKYYIWTFAIIMLLTVIFLMPAHSFKSKETKSISSKLTIEVSQAKLLDINKTSIEDVYKYIKMQDNIWSKKINNKEYLRVTFEQNLTNTKDITIYARGNSSQVEVYRENDDSILATFSNISEENWHKIYLTNLSDEESYDVFDLKSVGSVEYDYIVDPTYQMCYQESANTTNQTGIDGSCGLNYSGAYSSIGNLSDGNWSTGETTTQIYINYTIPAGAVNSSLWQVADGKTIPTITNLSLTACDWGINILQLRTSFQTGSLQHIYWACFNISSTWAILRDYSLFRPTPNLKMFEEAMWWNISTADSDTTYPNFSGYWDSNATLTGSGIGLFNVTVTNTNGTVFLSINNTNITATNLTANVYNASYSFNSSGTYSYYWGSWGNGTSHLYNVSEIRSYTVNSCITNLLNTSWSDWTNSGSCDIHDNQTQIRNLTQYDSNSCGEVANQTLYEYQNISCNYCSYNIINSSWADWTNITCLADNTMNQTRNKTEYDENYLTCYVITGLPSDLWNSGENNTYFEYRNTLNCGEQPTPQTPSNSGGGGSTKPECNLDSNCKTGYSCYSNKCAKLFDAKIIDIVSPIKSREFFNLTYYIKGMAKINGDVIITFWIQNESNKLNLGKDTIYLGILEEKTQTVRLFMPNTLESGIYDFYTQVKYENYSAESYRKIEIIASPAGMQINNLNETTTANRTNDEETPKKEHNFVNNIKGIINKMGKFFSSIGESISQNKNYLFIGFGVLIVLAGIFILIRILIKRKSRNMTKLKNLRGLRVYSEDGNYIGRLKETYLEDGKAKIYGYLIKLNKKITKRVGKRNILVKHKYMKAVRNIMIIDEAIAEHLENIKEK